jgi:hypothetical protein
MAFLLILVGLLIIILFVYLKLKYFILRGPLPGKSPQFLFGNLLQMGELRGVSPATISLKMQAEYGDVYQYWVGPMHMICISNIEDIQHVFNHRHIYEQGDMHIKQFGVFFPDGLICILGQ